jgi:hypothetical protein
MISVRSWIRGSAAVAALLVALPASRVAFAEEENPVAIEVKALEDSSKGNISNASEDGMRADVLKAVSLGKDMADAKLKQRCAQVVVNIVKFTASEDLRRQCIKAFGDLALPSTGPAIHQFLLQPDPDKTPPLLMDAIECAGKLKSDDSVELLLQVVEDSHVLPNAVAAIQALGNYGESKNKRQIILDRLVATVSKDVPGVGKRWQGSNGITGGGRTPTKKTRSGEDIVNRYNSLSGEMVTALNKLTGQSCAAPEDWFELRDKYKGRLGELFPKS